MGNPANAARVRQTATAAKADDTSSANTATPTVATFARWKKTSEEKKTATENGGTMAGAMVDRVGKLIRTTRRKRNGSRRTVRPTVAVVAILSGVAILPAVKKGETENGTVR